MPACAGMTVFRVDHSEPVTRAGLRNRPAGRSQQTDQKAPRQTAHAGPYHRALWRPAHLFLVRTSPRRAREAVLAGPLLVHAELHSGRARALLVGAVELAALLDLGGKIQQARARAYARQAADLRDRPLAHRHDAV